jgi:hypothetical protein
MITGKSPRLAYYLLDTEEKKNEWNAGRRIAQGRTVTLAVGTVPKPGSHAINPALHTGLDGNGESWTEGKTKI